MTGYWVDYDALIEGIEDRFTALLMESHGLLHFDAMADIAWDELGIPSFSLSTWCRGAAADAMDNIADYDTTLERYAEVAVEAIMRIARQHGWLARTCEGSADPVG